LPNPSGASQIISEPYVDAERAAAHLSISRKTLLRLARRGAVPGHGIGKAQKRMWRFRISELDYWMHSEVTSVSDEGRSTERKTFL
jgi:Helix-turn-helix domain